MERTTALSRVGHRYDGPERAVIGNRDPGADRNRDDQATRGCFHIASIVDATRLLKCFLLVR